MLAFCYSKTSNTSFNTQSLLLKLYILISTEQVLGFTLNLYTSHTTHFTIIVNILTCFTIGTFITTLLGVIRMIGKVETGRTPSPEPGSSLFELLTFTWLSPLVTLGNKRPLEAGDLWDLVEGGKLLSHLNLDSLFT